VSHDFLSVLEESGSVCRERGWLPQHVVVREATEDAAAPGGGGDAGGANQGRVVAVCPLYLKGHSQGEYVFDHGWAQAFERHGVAYYPKLQSCVPFTPATGPRIMVRDLGDARREAEVGVAVARTLADVGKQMGVSSVHVTFPTEADVEALEATGRGVATALVQAFADAGMKVEIETELEKGPAFEIGEPLGEEHTAAIVAAMSA